MMVMTKKVDFKKIAIGLIAAVGVIVALLMLLGGGNETASTAVSTVSDNDARVQFLSSFGWQVTTSPVESGQVRIPKEQSEVFERYNALQKSQGYDLLPYSGKTVMRYVYQVENYPDATDPVYATLLVYKNKIIGGDITNTAAHGAIQGFQMPSHSAAPESGRVTESTQSATETTAPTVATS